MEKFGGSELVALELAEELHTRGHEVTIWTHVLLEPIRSHITVPITKDRPDLAQFDWIWAHHNMIAGYGPRPGQRIVTNHMSSYVDLEFPADAAWEDRVAHRVFANSPETQTKMIQLGLARCEVFPNPAPAMFHVERTPRYGLFVSNHRPVVLNIMAATLGCPNRFYGERDRFERITPEIMSGAHFVVCNGKTVQYAMRAGVPVFLFDHMGGPGWLTDVNVEKAAAFNFSGRCTKGAVDLSALNAWRSAKPVVCPDRMRLEWWIGELGL